MGKTSIKQIAISLGIVCGLFSCKSDPLENLPTDLPEDNMEVLFKLKLPASPVRAKADEPFHIKECEVTGIDVLVFQVNELNNNKEEFAYRAVVQSFTTGAATDEVICTIKLVKTTTQCRLVVFANLTEELNSLPGVITGKEKEEIISGFIYTRNNEWNTPLETGFTPLPMWAETILTAITEETSFPKINLLRMISRIDVETDESVTDEKFTLESVRLYNRKTKGYVVPLAAHISTESGQVHTPTLPTEDGTLTVKNPSKAYSKAMDTDNHINYIYAFETGPPVSGKAEDATCLVIGGKYNTSGTETFYRIDFAGKEGATYGNLLRNSQYILRINDVLSEGYPTPDDAFEGQSMNITGEIIEWNQGETTHIIFFGPHFVAIDRKDVLLGSKRGNRLIREMSTNIEPEKIKLSFIGDHNGATIKTSDGIGIENERFRVRLLQTDNEITHMTFTAINIYNPSLPETNKQELEFTAYNIRFIICIEQQETDTSDWKEGGDYDFEF